MKKKKIISLNPAYIQIPALTLTNTNWALRAHALTPLNLCVLLIITITFP